MSTLAEVQKMWRERWADPPRERPSCFNRPDYPPPWFPGCPHWKPGGNAFVLLKRHDTGGRMGSWHDCSGCRQKNIAQFAQEA